MLLAAVLLPCAAIAQKHGVTIDETPLVTPRQEWLLRHNPRVPATNEQWAERMGKASRINTKGNPASTLPSNRWFPGEWEEVQAVCITWPYITYPMPNGTPLTSEYATPMFSGMGYYYRDARSNTSYGFGPIAGVPDTSVSSFILVFANVINAIQQGGAEAWVNVWQYSDTSIILRTMQRIGMPMTRYRWIQSYGNSYWYRDCGPICFYYGDNDSIGMLDFMYYPERALDDSLPIAIEAQIGLPNWESSIEWEGGNCLVDGSGMVVSSDAIYTPNADHYGRSSWNGRDESSIAYSYKEILSQNAVYDSLRRLLGSRATHILPSLAYDGGTGHIDLYADMLDENEFVFSQYPTRYSNWRDYRTASRNIDSLCSYRTLFGNRYKRRYLPFPRTRNGNYFNSQSLYSSDYARSYSNHTFVNNVIIQPCFSDVVNGEPSAAWDRQNIDSIRNAYPGYTLYPVNVASFDGMGGAIHCITKQIPADNPIRILHSSITGSIDRSAALSDIPVRATITNRSGIASATLHYRIGDSQWQSLPLAANGNEYSAAIPSAQLNHSANETLRVDYYISATSNNGKTITKPFTAATGGHYTFCLASNTGQINTPATNNATVGLFHPNPASGMANIELSVGTIQTVNVTIVNALGQTVHQSSAQIEGDIVYSINTHNLSKGLYTVIFTTPQGAPMPRRLIVQ